MVSKTAVSLPLKSSARALALSSFKSEVLSKAGWSPRFRQSRQLNPQLKGPDKIK
jgi:hypothetical protein